MKKPWMARVYVGVMGSLLLMSVAVSQTLPDWSTLFENNKSSIVSITVKGKEEVPTMPGFPFFFDERDPFSFFFGEPRQRSQKPRERIVQAGGSGFIVDQNGLIVTNAHVVGKADEILVQLSDRRELPAKLVGKDDRSDVAVLQIDAKNLPAVKIADVKDLKVGQWVMAVGSPFGLDYTATQGIISSLGRNLPSDSYTPFIQTDAAINPGNSGGPLFNTKGEVIGINSQIYTSTGSYAGVSFAIPIDLAMDVVQQLQSNGKVVRGWLGVQIQDVNADLAKTFNLDKPQGAIVSSIVPNGPAAKSDLQVGDVILSFNGQTIHTSSELPVLVSRAKVDQPATLEILRHGKKQNLTVDIKAVDGDQLAVTAQNGAHNLLGITVEALPQNSVQQGVVISGVTEGAAADVGIRDGDIISQINGQNILTVADFNQALASVKKGDVVRLLVHRGSNAYFVAVPIKEKS
ncbi:serine protease [Wohlfahrtiimonas chitiniclastica]|uniref:DegQ family serine endoprotease n=1 Tax=Wohlfahrtiimonas chitiniclastica TaxID=400946 RepID=A0AB35C009_9GAMM|nr:DegQ family serine endoprotease [Wohlfahrtiimonas chitiniclastica]KZX37164.1 serine protease [Wohlfahrtiimonas chitiniclastica]MBS7820969.1 DegQ family serine endoprotease [Wohlfahrtiimonas chitiniclastica]MBS7824902.1 DegQ family serine endoprotease [Wohlfahrtiimonas chitiniclastica]MBS7833791.1 DegQ family serine endoprotease [Wohlfahrtiimonas chitiniclastica]MBS7840511.1 DegQ family serine endoprotease [Wohlfahrtiimonas chitiniclastica]